MKPIISEQYNPVSPVLEMFRHIEETSQRSPSADAIYVRHSSPVESCLFFSVEKQWGAVTASRTQRWLPVIASAVSLSLHGCSATLERRKALVT